jgi:hypothetical protein
MLRREISALLNACGARRDSGFRTTVQAAGFWHLKAELVCRPKLSWNPKLARMDSRGRRDWLATTSVGGSKASNVKSTAALTTIPGELIAKVRPIIVRCAPLSQGRRIKMEEGTGCAIFALVLLGDLYRWGGCQRILNRIIGQKTT